MLYKGLPKDMTNSNMIKSRPISKRNQSSWASATAACITVLHQSSKLSHPQQPYPQAHGQHILSVRPQQSFFTTLLPLPSTPQRAASIGTLRFLARSPHLSGIKSSAIKHWAAIPLGLINKVYREKPGVCQLC